MSSGRCAPSARRSRGSPRRTSRQPDVVYQIGVPPCRVDLLTSLTGLGFDEAWAQRVTGLLGGLDVPFIGRDALVRNKRALGRPRDLADLESLEPGPECAERPASVLLRPPHPSLPRPLPCGCRRRTACCARRRSGTAPPRRARGARIAARARQHEAALRGRAARRRRSDPERPGRRARRRAVPPSPRRPASSKPASQWLPSQNGRFFVAPQRHSATRVSRAPACRRRRRLDVAAQVERPVGLRASPCSPGASARARRRRAARSAGRRSGSGTPPRRPRSAAASAGSTHGTRPGSNTRRQAAHALGDVDAASPAPGHGDRPGSKTWRFSSIAPPRARSAAGPSAGTDPSASRLGRELRGASDPLASARDSLDSAPHGAAMSVTARTLRRRRHRRRHRRPGHRHGARRAPPRRGRRARGRGPPRRAPDRPQQRRHPLRPLLQARLAQGAQLRRGARGALPLLRRARHRRTSAAARSWSPTRERRAAAARRAGAPRPRQRARRACAGSARRRSASASRTRAASPGCSCRDTGIVDYAAVTEAYAGARARARGGEIATRRASRRRARAGRRRGPRARDRARARCAAARWSTAPGCSPTAWRACAASSPACASCRSAASTTSCVPERRHLVRNLIYPVPDPALPVPRRALHAHDARRRRGRARTRCSRSRARATRARRLLAARHRRAARPTAGFWRMALAALAHGPRRVVALVQHAARSCAALRRLVPEIARRRRRAARGAGVRAQAVEPDGQARRRLPHRRGRAHDPRAQRAVARRDRVDHHRADDRRSRRRSASGWRARRGCSRPRRPAGRGGSHEGVRHRGHGIHRRPPRAAAACGTATSCAAWSAAPAPAGPSRSRAPRPSRAT